VIQSAAARRQRLFTLTVIDDLDVIVGWAYTPASAARDLCKRVRVQVPSAPPTRALTKVTGAEALNLADG